MILIAWMTLSAAASAFIWATVIIGIVPIEHYPRVRVAAGWMMLTAAGNLAICFSTFPVGIVATLVMAVTGIWMAAYGLSKAVCTLHNPGPLYPPTDEG